MSLLENQFNISNLRNLNHVYRAVVENNDDGGSGKCQVRILGIHSPIAKRTGENQGVPVEELPWAETIRPTALGGGVSGVGVSGVPLKGTWVWVSFDGGDWNKPVILGSIIGSSETNESQFPDKGFGDPDKKYPRPETLGEPSTNRYSSNRKIDETPVILKKDADRDIAPFGEGNTWEENKEETSSVKYTKNVVIESEAGAAIELDSSHGARVHIFEPSGGYIELIKTGDITIQAKKDHIVIVDNNTKHYYKNNFVETISNNKVQTISGDVASFIGGTEKRVISGGQTIDGGPQIKMTAGMIYLN